MFMVISSVPLYLDIVKIEGDVPVPSKEEQERKNKLQNKIVNSNIISATIAGKDPDDKGMIMLPPGEGVYYTLEHKTVRIFYNLVLKIPD